MLFLPHPPVSFQKLLVIPTREPAQRAKRDWMAMLMKAFGTDWSVPQWCGLLRPKRINGGIFSLWIPVCLFGRWYQSYAQTWARGSNESTQNYPISTLKMIRLVLCVFLMLGIEHRASPYQASALPLSYSYSIHVLLPLSSHRHHQYVH